MKAKEIEQKLSHAESAFVEASRACEQINCLKRAVARSFEAWSRDPAADPGVPERLQETIASLNKAYAGVDAVRRAAWSEVWKILATVQKEDEVLIRAYGLTSYDNLGKIMVYCEEKSFEPGKECLLHGEDNHQCLIEYIQKVCANLQAAETNARLDAWIREQEQL